MKRNLVIVEIFWILSTVAFIFSQWDIVGPHGMIGIFNKIIWYIILGCIFILFSFVQKNRARFLNLLLFPIFLSLILSLIVYNLHIGKWHDRILIPSFLIVVFIFLYYSILHIEISLRWKNIMRKNSVSVITLLVMPIVAISIAFFNHIYSYMYAENAPWAPVDYPRIIWFRHSWCIWLFGFILIGYAFWAKWKEMSS